MSGLSAESPIPGNVDVRSFLARAPFFEPLNDVQIDAIGKSCHVESFPSGQSIYHVGALAEDFYLLVEGSVRFTLGNGPRSMTYGELLRPGEAFGWAALVSGAQRRSATACCDSPCTVIAMGGTQLLELMDTDHSLGYYVMKQLNALINAKLTSFVAA